ncbi:hypothetical protein [Streptomyces sp. NPDC051561]|uniref:hypothetical protein n=1 Tax=Streptomyces sp. NPDC051561 TaxID=3365658 RepID=UPI0037A83838
MSISRPRRLGRMALVALSGLAELVTILLSGNRKKKRPLLGGSRSNGSGDGDGGSGSGS